MQKDLRRPTRPCRRRTAWQARISRSNDGRHRRPAWWAHHDPNRRDGRAGKSIPRAIPPGSAGSKHGPHAKRPAQDRERRTHTRRQPALLPKSARVCLAHSTSRNRPTAEAKLHRFRRGRNRARRAAHMRISTTPPTSSAAPATRIALTGVNRQAQQTEMVEHDRPEHLPCDQQREERRGAKLRNEKDRKRDEDGAEQAAAPGEKGNARRSRG